MNDRFRRKIEDFICAQCGAQVAGDGYTNHCPKCLYSLHVDIMPGDRAAGCGGLMVPVRVEVKKGGWVIWHRCQVCGHEHPNKSRPEDDSDALRAIAQAAAHNHRP
jgi:hypothetical protein